MTQARRDAEAVLVLDTGDALAGGRANGSTTLGDRTEGAVIVAAMNALQYDAMALGPYDLGLGSDALAARLSEAAFPIVSANAYREDGRPVVPPYAVLDVAGRHLAVIGLTRPLGEDVDGFEVREPRAALVAALEDAAEESDVVVVLTNLDVEAARSTVEGLDRIGLVVAAIPVLPAGVPGARAMLPDHAIRIDEGGALLVTAERGTAGHTGRRVGRLQATVEPDGAFVGEQWSTVSLDDTLADDPEMAALLAEFERTAPWP